VELVVSDDDPPSPSEAEARPSRSAGLDRTLWHALFEDAPDGIAFADRDGRYVELNTRFCEIVGRARAELLSMTITDLVVPEEHERLAAARGRLPEGNENRHEWRIRRGDGGEAIIEVSARLLPDGGCVAFIHDVSARRRDEDERQRAAKQHDAERQWLRAVLDTVPLGVILFDPDRRITFNAHAERLLGTALPHTSARPFRVLARDGTPLDADQLVTLPVLHEGRTLMGLEVSIERPDGSRIPVLGNAAPIRDADGTIIGGVGVFEDVSAQLRDQALVHANERLLDGIFELLPVGVWIADHTGHIVRGNPAGSRIWGSHHPLAPSELGRGLAWRVATGEPVVAEDRALSRAIREGVTTIGERLRIRCFDGSSKTILHSALPLRDEHQHPTGAIVVDEDVTELQETEEALRRAIASRDEVLRVVSHDLRSPLQTIALTTQDLLRRADPGPSGEALRASTQRILRVSRRMSALIDQLLDIASIDASRLGVRPERLDPDALVRECVDIHQAQAQVRQISLTMAVMDAPVVWADHDRMLQALSNLVGNALKFTPAGGIVTVGAVDDVDAVRISVVDSGPGIPTELVERVFEPFWQRKPGDRRGRGLGLAIAKGIIEAHDGRIWIESEPGHGTRVCFTIPKAAPDPGPGLAQA
jgi:PAS domain S-box-containing protein